MAVSSTVSSASTFPPPHNSPSRHFVGAKALGTHKRSKVHKRRLKELAEGAYTLEEANAAAGRGAPDYGKPEAVADAEEDKEM